MKQWCNGIMAQWHNGAKVKGTKDYETKRKD